MTNPFAAKRRRQEGARSRRHARRIADGRTGDPLLTHQGIPGGSVCGDQIRKAV